MLLLLLQAVEEGVRSLQREQKTSHLRPCPLENKLIWEGKISTGYEGPIFLNATYNARIQSKGEAGISSADPVLSYCLVPGDESMLPCVLLSTQPIHRGAGELPAKYPGYTLYSMDAPLSDDNKPNYEYDMAEFEEGLISGKMEMAWETKRMKVGNPGVKAFLNHLYAVYGVEMPEMGINQIRAEGCHQIRSKTRLGVPKAPNDRSDCLVKVRNGAGDERWFEYRPRELAALNLMDQFADDPVKLIQLDIQSGGLKVTEGKNGEKRLRIFRDKKPYAKMVEVEGDLGAATAATEEAVEAPAADEAVEEAPATEEAVEEAPAADEALLMID